MRILNIIQRYHPAIGGSETWCREVATYLVRCGHRVEVATLKVIEEDEYWKSLEPATKRLSSNEDVDGVTIRRYRRTVPTRLSYLFVYRLIFDRLLNVCFYGPHSYQMYAGLPVKILHSDIVFLHALPHPHNFVGLAYAKIFGKKVMVAPHFHPGHPNYERPANYWLLNHCDKIVVDTVFERDHLLRKGIPNNRIEVVGVGINPEVYHPVNLEEFRHRLYETYSISPEEKLITFVGRKLPAKGLEELVEAATATRAHFRLRLFLVGPSTEWFDALYAGLSPSQKEYLIDMGTVSHSDKVNLLHLSDLLVLPSRFEAFAIVLLEAWLCGAAVLGTREGAIPSVIGNDGFLCKAGDPSDLARAMADALSDPQRLRSLGSQGREKVLRTYTSSKVGQRVNTLLEEMEARR